MATFSLSDLVKTAAIDTPFISTLNVALVQVVWLLMEKDTL